MVSYETQHSFRLQCWYTTSAVKECVHISTNFIFAGKVRQPSWFYCKFLQTFIITFTRLSTNFDLAQPARAKSIKERHPRISAAFALKHHQTELFKESNKKVWNKRDSVYT